MTRPVPSCGLLACRDPFCWRSCSAAVFLTRRRRIRSETRSYLGAPSATSCSVAQVVDDFPGSAELLLKLHQVAALCWAALLRIALYRNLSPSTSPLHRPRHRAAGGRTQTPRGSQPVPTLDLLAGCSRATLPPYLTPRLVGFGHFLQATYPSYLPSRVLIQSCRSAWTSSCSLSSPVCPCGHC